MTMYMIVGDGELPKKEVIATLEDLYEKSRKAEEEFWFTVLGKDEPTATDKVILEWLAENQIYYEAFTDVDEDALDDVYAGRQKLHKGKKLPLKAVNLLKAADEGENRLLALFVDLKSESDEDTALYEILGAAIDAGYDAFGLNDSMVKIDLGDGEDGEEDEPAAAPSKSAAKKAAAPAKKAAGATKKATAKAEGPRRYTREELEDLTDAEVRSVGSSLGITTRGRAKWIERILEKQGTDGEADEGDEAETDDGDVTEIKNGALMILVNPDTGTILTKPLSQKGAADVTKVLLGEE